MGVRVPILGAFMEYELISSTCIPANPSFYLSLDEADAHRSPDVEAMEQIIAWRIDTFHIPGEVVPTSTISPITINGSVDSGDYAILRPDGTLEHPDEASARPLRPRLNIVRD